MSTTISGSSKIVARIATFADWTMIGRRNIGLGVTIITMTMTTIMIGITTGTKAKSLLG